MSTGAVEQVAGYTDLRRAGQGGFSVVYRAHQEALQRTVALKVLLMDVADDHELRRFQRECQLTGRLTGHPNIVTVLDTGTTRSGRPYVAMEYFEGGSLADRLRRIGPLSVEAVLRNGVKIAGALAAAHAAGILHRDVKPQNVLISRYGEPALADFGIATLVGTVDVSAGVDALTPYHAAPEILEGHPPTVASDVYSLGSTLYHLLAGRPAHQRDDGGGMAPLLLRIISEDPPDIGRPEVPAEVEAAIRKAMARAPEDRYPDALAFAGRLRELQSGLGLPVTELVEPGAGGEAARPSPPPVPAAPASRSDRTIGVARPDNTMAMPGLVLDRPAPAPPKRRSRRPLVVVAASTVAGAIVAGAILALTSHGGSPPAPARATPPASAAPAAAAVPSAVMEAARPVAVAAQDRGTSVVLRWQLGTGSRYPLFVQEAPVGRQAPPLTPLAAGTTTATIAGLDPRAGYCFQVGALVALGQPSAVAWSTPACIRGAVAQPTAVP